MALFPFYHHRFFNDPFFFHHFDVFDPWFDFDVYPSFTPITPRFRSIKEQQRLSYSLTNVSNNANSLELPTRAPEPEKFRVELNVDGFDPEAIKKRIEGQQLIVEGKQEDRQEKHDHTVRELRATYSLPTNADANRLTTHITPNKMMVIEAPIQSPQSERRIQQVNNDRSLTQSGQHRGSSSGVSRFFDCSNCQRRIADKGNNQNKLEMVVDMKNYRPEDINVSVTNNELIIKGEHQHNDGNRSERSTFFRSTTLPPGIQVNKLESHLNDDGQLKIEAPYA